MSAAHSDLIERMPVPRDCLLPSSHVPTIAIARGAEAAHSAQSQDEKQVLEILVFWIAQMRLRLPPSLLRKWRMDSAEDCSSLEVSCLGCVRGLPVPDLYPGISSGPPSN